MDLLIAIIVFTTFFMGCGALWLVFFKGWRGENKQKGSYLKINKYRNQYKFK